MLGLSLWEGRLPGQKTIENEDKAAMGSYRPESNFGTSDTVLGKFSETTEPKRSTHAKDVHKLPGTHMNTRL